MLRGWASGLLAAIAIGWVTGSAAGSAAASVIACALVAAPIRDKTLYTWARLYMRRHEPVRFGGVLTVLDEGTNVGVRITDDIAVVAIQVLGKPHEPTRLIGAAPETTNTLDLCLLIPSLKQSLGITLDSISVVMAGSRRTTCGDYPRIYDTLIGPAPYAGRRETWLLLRLPGLRNGEALQWRTSLGSAAAACARRTVAVLSQLGIRARVATAGEISEFERRMGSDGIAVRNRHWDALRSDGGWLTSYSARTADFDPDKLGEAWLWQVDGVIQNVTLLPDRTATVTVTVRSNQRLTSAPSSTLRPMTGEQARAAALNMCVPRRSLEAVGPVGAPRSLVLPVGQSGVLIGKYRTGGRMLLPLTDAAGESRIHIGADDSIAQRVIMRLAGAGEHITVHTGDGARWKRLRMANIVVTDGIRPERGTTVSVVDGTISPLPRPRTIISVGGPRKPAPSADVLLTQVAPQTLRVTTGGIDTEIDVEMFRVEKPYLPLDRSESA